MPGISRKNGIRLGIDPVVSIITMYFMYIYTHILYKPFQRSTRAALRDMLIQNYFY